MKSTGFQILKVLLFFALGAFILYLMYNSQQAAYLEECRLKNTGGDCSLLQKIIADFKSVHWFWIGSIILTFILSNIARALRWHQILQVEGYFPRLINSFGTIMIGFFVNLGLPRAGELARTGLLAKYETIPVEKVLASVVLDRIADVFALLVILFGTVLVAQDIILDFIQENMKEGILLKLGIAGCIGLLLALGTYFYIRGQLKSGNTSWLYSKIASFTESLLSIRMLKNVPLFVFYTLVIWICYYLMTYLCFFAFDPTAHLSMKAGLIVFVLGTLGIVFPSPGGMGSYHFLVTQGLLLFGIAGSDAFAFANIVFFTIQLFCNVGLGALFLFGLPLINSKQVDAA